MPTVNIDGKNYEFEGKPGLLNFCLENGIEIPYFCYHPAMSTPTNCRMCLIDLGFHARDRASGEFQFNEDGDPVINWGRKPATACNTKVGPGMFVKTGHSSEEISTAQKGVLEYMLANHPLDCPICDQAGECPLQVWTYKYGPEGSRFEVEKVHKPKRIELGPNVVLDAERCINCTRCTRFTEEISGSNQLTIINRGDKNLPSTAPGEVFDDPYSMNTIDLCPVGALTSRQHRFKSRVWEMSYTPSIDMNDSTGTNIFVWVRDNEVMRITPRKNLEINNYWMPDAHRLGIDRYNKDRVSGIKLKGDLPVDFGVGIDTAASRVKQAKGSILFLGSPHASLESNYMLQQFAQESGVNQVHYVRQVQEGFGDGWLIQDDRSPNSASCELLGFEAIDADTLAGKLRSGDISLLYALENDELIAGLGSSLEGIEVIAHATQHKEGMDDLVDILLPAATAIEGEGIYLNHKGSPQASQMAKQIAQMSPDMWMRLAKSRLDKGAVAVDNWRNLDNIFDVLPSWLLIAKLGRELGYTMPYEDHRDIFKKLKEEHYELLKDVKVSYRPPKSAFKTSQLDFAPQWGSM